MHIIEYEAACLESVITCGMAGRMHDCFVPYRKADTAEGVTLYRSQSAKRKLTAVYLNVVKEDSVLLEFY